MTGSGSDKYIIGLTGGIGTGKSTAARLFRMMNFPVFDSDAVALQCYFKPDIREKTEALLGKNAYLNQNLNKPYIRECIFKDHTLRKKLEELIHPCVKNEFESFVRNTNTPWVVKESALLFETGIYKTCHFTVLVTAPESLRIQRIKERDGLDEKEIVRIMKAQWSEQKKAEYADAIIYNDEKHSLILQVEELVHKLKGFSFSGDGK